MNKYIIFCFIFYVVFGNIYAQSDKKSKSDINSHVTAAYIKSYLAYHPNAKIALVYNDAEDKEEYATLKEKIVNFIEAFNLDVVNVNDAPKRVINIGKKKSEKNSSKANGWRLAYLNKLNETNSDILIFVEINRSSVEIVRKNKLKGLNHFLSVGMRLYFKHRLENQNISFRNTYYDICLTPILRDRESSSSVNVSEVLSSISSLINLVPCSDCGFHYSDTVKTQINIDRYLVNKVNRFANKEFRIISKNLSKNEDELARSKIYGAIEPVSLTEKTANVKMVKPVYRKSKGLLNKIEGVFDLSCLMLAKVDGDDKVTPWVVEKEHTRYIGSLKIKKKERTDDFRGGAVVKKLPNGFDSERVDAVILVNKFDIDEEGDWMCMTPNLVDDVSDYNFVTYSIQGKNIDEFIDDFIDDLRKRNIEASKLAKSRSEMDKLREMEDLLFRLRVIYPTSRAYLNKEQANNLLFPPTVIEERSPMRKDKKEKGSIVARIKQLEKNNSKIGVVFALREFYVKKESSWKTLSSSFFVKGRELTNKLNEKFDTNIFELINYYDIPTEEQKVSKLMQSGLKYKLGSKKFPVPVFEKTQYPVIVSYHLYAYKNTAGERKISSELYPMAFYDGGERVSLSKRIMQLQIHIPLSDITVKSGTNYEDYIEQLNRQEDKALDDYVEKALNFYSEKVAK